MLIEMALFSLPLPANIVSGPYSLPRTYIVIVQNYRLVRHFSCYPGSTAIGYHLGQTMSQPQQTLEFIQMHSCVKK